MCFPVFSQIQISGTILDRSGKPIAGANVFLEGSYDGAVTDSLGQFAFDTPMNGTKHLMVTASGFEPLRIALDRDRASALKITMRESAMALDAVVVTAGTLEAGDKARVSVLKPLDIVTTAGSAGNIVAALQTLPGTQAAAEDGRLFVRGGRAEETQTFVDGIRVSQPYGATLENLPTRGRFSPFLFSGISFSTGGYSAEYGDALSGVLLLNTADDIQQEKTDISLMTVGLGLGNTQKWGSRSLTFNTSYIDLSPYQAAVPQQVKFNRAYQSISGEAVYRQELQKGVFKVYAAFDAARFGVDQDLIDQDEPLRIGVRNNNFYFNSSLKYDLPANWQLFAGAGAGIGRTLTGIDRDQVSEDDDALHLKLKFSRRLRMIRLNVGAEWFRNLYSETFDDGNLYRRAYHASAAAGFAEADFLFSKNFAVKTGLRIASHEKLGGALSPRVSAALKLHPGGQVSIAAGTFAQSPGHEFLKQDERFAHEEATHLILNYQYSKNKRMLRFEAYAKDYSNLVRFDTVDGMQRDFSQSGYGYAHGAEIFWRDARTVRNLEYWISYSLLDTKRLYREFPSEATPGFAAKHTFSAVAKIWVNSLKSQIGLTNTFASGRPYENPERSGYLESRTRGYNNLSASWAYLLTSQKILYFSVSNVLGTDNVFGYRYAAAAGGDGTYRRQAIGQQADRFFFIGLFWTISDDGKSNQLRNL